MTPSKKKVPSKEVAEGAIVTHPEAEAKEEEDYEVEHTADGELQVDLESLGVAAEDIVALRRIEAIVAKGAART